MINSLLGFILALQKTEHGVSERCQMDSVEQRPQPGVPVAALAP